MNMDTLNTQEVRRKRPGTFISSGVVSRQISTDEVVNERVCDSGLQEDDKSFYEDLNENSCNDMNEAAELYSVSGEAVVPQLIKPKQYENKYLINSAEVRRTSNIETEAVKTDKTVCDLSKVLNLSNNKCNLVKYEEREVPLKVYSSTSLNSSTVSRIPKTTAVSEENISSDGYKPNFSFNIYSTFAVNEVVPSVDYSTNLQTTVKNQNYPIFLNADKEQQIKRSCQIEEPTLPKQTTYMINKHSFHGMYAHFSRQRFESQVVNFEKILGNEIENFDLFSADRTLSNKNQKLSSKNHICFPERVSNSFPERVSNSFSKRVSNSFPERVSNSFPQNVQFSDSPGAENKNNKHTFY
ncbi:uncharacterized protein LOC124815363 isoform X2 [Hydra vulgaris]|uniref:uncharacterized protein LOC124815363 isoform X2 n=1 Tax=Hydra vulgaris TaxID=6087 RepID=UPI001F5EB11A|nr:uncharacterized protein LOC124815363 isoform X2 [Hydra vulgaris]